MSQISKNTTNIILYFIAAVLAVAFGVVLFFDSKEQQAEYAKNIQANSQLQVERREKMIEMEERQRTDSFYQKLADGFDVKILIVGDSIGLGEGVSDSSLSWIDQMQTYLVDTYNVNVETKNVSLEYSTSYAGYVRTMALDETDYDLAIICYGQNDDEKYFGVFYEGVIRAIRSHNEKCSIISVLESSQQKYTNKINVIKELSEHYGNQVADTIAAFNDKENGGFSALTSSDGINPNDKGHKVYCGVITNVIDEEVKKGTVYNDEEIEVVNEWVVNLNKFKGITEGEFKRTDNKYIYTLDEPISGVFGIDYKFLTGENGCKIFIDGKEYKAPEPTVKSDSMQLYILPLNYQKINAKQSIEVRFSNEQQASGFKGICVTWE